MSKPAFTPEEAFGASISLCHRLREIRIEKEMSIYHLAELLDIKHYTVEKMETRKFSIGIDLLVRWASALEVNLVILKEN